MKSDKKSVCMIKHEVHCQTSSCAVSPSPALSTAVLRECSVAYVLLPLWSPGAHSCHSDNMALR